MAASMRMSKVPASAITEDSSMTASMAKAFAAIRPSIWATASCLPTGAPH